MLAFVVAALALGAAGPTGQPEQPRRAFLALVVNDTPVDEVIAVLAGSDLYLPVDSLEAAGLQGFAGVRRRFFGRPHVLLRSLEPDLRYRLDTADVVLYLTAAPQLFTLNRFTLQRDRPAGISYAHDFSAHLNYSATWDRTAGPSGFGEGGLAAFGNTSLLSGFSVDPSGHVLRGLSTLTIDRPSARLRWQIGDTLARASALGSSPVVGGFSFGREQSLDPYHFRYPTPSIQGSVTTPSEVEIFVNGALLRRFEIAPGPYRFDRLPISAGRGDVRVVVRDRFGRRQSYESTVYLASGLLTPGTTDFQYVGGRLRDDGEGRAAYGDVVGTAMHRFGVFDWLTLGAAGEGGRDAVSGGPSVGLRLARWGELQVDAWASRTRDRRVGYAAYGVYDFSARWLHLGVVGRYHDAKHASLSQPATTGTTPEFVQATAGLPLGRLGTISYSAESQRSPAGAFGLSAAGSFDPELVRANGQTIRINLRLFGSAQLSASTSTVQVRGTRHWTGSVGLDLVLGRSTSAAMTRYQEERAGRTTAEINRSLPIGPGFGYRLRASDTPDGDVGGGVEMNARFYYAALTFEAGQAGRRLNPAATLAGSMTATRGGVFFSRPLDLSSAVVEVGLSGVGVLADDVPVGRTGRSGRLFIPQLLPYLANRISVAEEDIPFDYTVPVTSRLVAPPYGGAATVAFRITRIHARSGRVRMVIDGVEEVPAYGSIAVFVNDRRVESPLNAEGAFFLDLPDGRHEAVVSYRGSSCRVWIEATPIRGIVQTVGQLSCTP